MDRPSVERGLKKSDLLVSFIANRSDFFHSTPLLNHHLYLDTLFLVMLLRIVDCHD